MPRADLFWSSTSASTTYKEAIDDRYMPRCLAARSGRTIRVVYMNLKLTNHHRSLRSDPLGVRISIAAAMIGLGKQVCPLHLSIRCFVIELRIGLSNNYMHAPKIGSVPLVLLNT